MSAPEPAKPTFDFKVIGITVLVCFLLFLAYLLSARFFYQANVAAEESSENSGESPIERKQYPKGYAEERPFEQVQQQAAQQQQTQQTQTRSAPVHREPPEKKPIVLGFGKPERRDAAAKVTPASAEAVAAEPPPDRPEYSRQGLDDQKNRFARNAGRSKAYVEDVLHQPLSKLFIRRGRLIPAVAVNAPSTEMPGDIFAMVTEDIKDSLTGRCVLHPGRLDNLRRNEQHRGIWGVSAAQAAWTGMSIEGTGEWIDLGSMPATNGQGRAGLYGKVDRHRGTLALALLGAVGVKLLGQAGAIHGKRRRRGDGLQRRRQRRGIIRGGPAQSSLSPVK